LNRNRVQSVHRALAILKAFDDASPVLGISELARRLGLSRSIVMRLVSTLRDGGFLEKEPGTDKYRIGLAAFEVGTLYHLNTSMRTHAQPLLEELAERLGFSAYLGTLSGPQVVYILAIEGTGPIRVGPRLGSAVPAHTTAAGKALLANLPPADLEAFLAAHSLVAETPHSITSKAELREHLRAIRARGYAVTEGEHLAQVSAIGAPVFDRNGDTVAAISVAFPSYLVGREQFPAIGEAVSETARAISRRLGYRVRGGIRERAAEGSGT